MKFDRAIELLVEGGWTTHYPRWGDARAHTYPAYTPQGEKRATLYLALRPKYVSRYTPGKGRSDVSWADHAKSADVWSSIPNENGWVSVIAIVFDRDGKPIRQVHTKNGWKARPVSNEDIGDLGRRESPQGRARAAEQVAAHEVERERKRAEFEAERARWDQLRDDAKMLLDEKGYGPDVIRRGTRDSEITIDLETFLSILRAP